MPKAYEDLAGCFSCRLRRLEDVIISMQHFTIQDWKDAGDLIMSHCSGIINPSNDLTKPLGLNEQHDCRIIGEFH